MNQRAFVKQKISKNLNRWVTGKHILITGATDGIGKELAINLLEDCHKLSLVARTQSNLNKLQSELNSSQRHVNEKTMVEIYPIDVNDTNGMIRIIKKIYDDDKEPIDAFINCAGGSHVFEKFENMSHLDIEQIFRANGEAHIHWLRELLPRMKKQELKTGDSKRAHIILMSSRSAERVLPNLVVYGAAKGSTEKLVEGLRREYSKFQIVFTLINPGSINTSFTKHWKKTDRERHNKDSMNVMEGVLPIIHALNMQIATNKISYESTKQWLTELGVV